MKGFFKVWQHYASHFVIVHVIENVISKLMLGVAGQPPVVEAKLTAK